MNGLKTSEMCVEYSGIFYNNYEANTKDYEVIQMKM